jgi:hypothetical protein
MTKRNFVVTVKEGGTGTPWLLVEAHEDNGVPAGAHITFDLPEGAPIEEAERVARFLNDNLAAIRLKTF